MEAAARGRGRGPRDAGRGRGEAVGRSGVRMPRRERRGVSRRLGPAAPIRSARRFRVGAAGPEGAGAERARGLSPRGEGDPADRRARDRLGASRLRAGCAGSRECSSPRSRAAPFRAGRRRDSTPRRRWPCPACARSSKSRPASPFWRPNTFRRAVGPGCARGDVGGRRQRRSYDRGAQPEARRPVVFAALPPRARASRATWRRRSPRPRPGCRRPTATASRRTRPSSPRTARHGSPATAARSGRPPRIPSAFRRKPPSSSRSRPRKSRSM